MHRQEVKADPLVVLNYGKSIPVIPMCAESNSGDRLISRRWMLTAAELPEIER